MGTARNTTLRNSNPTSQMIEATILSGASLSEWLDLGERRLSGLIMSADWTAAALSFDVSPDQGSTALPLFDENNAEVALTVAAARAHAFPISRMIGWNYIRLRSGLSGAVVNQAADRLLRIMVEP
jgi:hypothetical protein